MSIVIVWFETNRMTIILTCDRYQYLTVCLKCQLNSQVVYEIADHNSCVLDKYIYIATI